MNEHMSVVRLRRRIDERGSSICAFAEQQLLMHMNNASNYG